MVHLIGVDHKVQYMKSTAPASQDREANWKYYSSIIEGSIRDLRPSVVAEELNQELLDKKYNKAESLLLRIKKAHEERGGKAIRHIFAEPPSAEKQKLGIDFELPFSGLCPGVIPLSPPDGFPHLSDYEWHKHDIAHRFPIREDFWITQLG